MRQTKVRQKLDRSQTKRLDQKDRQLDRQKLDKNLADDRL